MSIDLPRIQLILLPPVGGTSRTFYPQSDLPCTVIPLDPIEWREGESIREHAARLYTIIEQDRRIDLTQPVVFGGLSLGGALAQELSLLHRPVGLILMGTFTSSRELSPIIRFICRLAQRIPLFAYKLSETLAPIVMRGLSYMTPEDIRLMTSDYKAFDKRSFRNTLRAIGEWRGTGVTIEVPTLRIHGKRDPLIPIGRIPHVDYALETMHLLSLSMAPDVNLFIENFLDSLDPGETSFLG